MFPRVGGPRSSPFSVTANCVKAAYLLTPDGLDPRRGGETLELLGTRSEVVFFLALSLVTSRPCPIFLFSLSISPCPPSLSAFDLRRSGAFFNPHHRKRKETYVPPVFPPFFLT
ncbi:hypothetical protein PtA15_12A343 [Puccinia triticina]|uniref:Uncharacterized protein n=1 Tax=Puccinia triticina TaxID=208348 RepID=A0ABY7D0G2_9BASI|nr:uncharacterized protein PtA15_12A343 [Puccinia triticina]WAQ90354.1 hypothetical protein PtA15_12A343 [Puccinia triticina]WAR61672.1 hypothetical protein PtB15_12B362 [Puccinia triticina]